jgi:hypothetical protein
MLWLLWLTVIIVAVARTLKRLPYARTRFQQLCFRFFLFQKLVIVAFIAVLDAYPLISFFIAYVRDYRSVVICDGVLCCVSVALLRHLFCVCRAIRHRPSASAGSPNSTNSNSNISRAQWVSNIVSHLEEGYQPIGLLLLVTVYACVMAISFMPPVVPAAEDQPTEPATSQSACVPRSHLLSCALYYVLFCSFHPSIVFSSSVPLCVAAAGAVVDDGNLMLAAIVCPVVQA